ncbi:MAG: hypothetical protein FWD72_01335 [Eggerthellaceae bacterium]|nr:hypothetical protein [Eggerthellaceae bacterium]
MAITLNLPTSSPDETSRHPWHGMAFILESLVLIVFIILSTVVLMQFFNASRIHGEKANALSYAVILASNEAERFAADPVSSSTLYYGLSDGALVPVAPQTEGSFMVVREVQSESLTGGVMYRAQISVEQQGETLYTISTEHYRPSGTAQ